MNSDSAKHKLVLEPSFAYFLAAVFASAAVNLLTSLATSDGLKLWDTGSILASAVFWFFASIPTVRRGLVIEETRVETLRIATPEMSKENIELLMQQELQKKESRLKELRTRTLIFVIAGILFSLVPHALQSIEALRSLCGRTGPQTSSKTIPLPSSAPNHSNAAPTPSPY